MMQVMNISKMVWMLLCACVLGGCSSTKIKTEPYYAGKIMVLPVSDAVHGKKGSAIAGSGKAFQKQLADNLSKSSFKAVMSSSQKVSTSHGSTRETSLKEARKSGAFYCLQVTLGELHTAKPGARRPDYAYVENAWLYNAWTGEIVWQLSKPLYAEKSNAGNPSILFNLMAAFVSDSIVENTQPNIAGHAKRYKAASANQYYHEKGREQLKQRQFSKAIKYFELALKYDPNDEDAQKAIRWCNAKLAK